MVDTAHLHMTPGDHPAELDGAMEDRAPEALVILLVGLCFSFLTAFATFLYGAGFWQILASYGVGGSSAMVLVATLRVANLRSRDNRDNGSKERIFQSTRTLSH